MPYIQPSHQPGKNNSLQKNSNGCLQNTCSALGKQHNFAVVFFIVFFLLAHGLKESKDIEAQFAYILAVLADQAYTVISLCMLENLSGCYFLPEDIYLIDKFNITSSSGPCN